MSVTGSDGTEKGQTCLLGTQMVTLVGNAKCAETVVTAPGTDPAPKRTDMTRPW